MAQNGKLLILTTKKDKTM